MRRLCASDEQFVDKGRVGDEGLVGGERIDGWKRVENLSDSADSSAVGAGMLQKVRNEGKKKFEKVI